MARWSLDSPPSWVKEKCVLTERGWEGVESGEIYIAIGEGATKSGAAKVLSVEFEKVPWVSGEEIAVAVHFNQYVDVTAGANIVVKNDGDSGDITLYAAAQSGVSRVVFDKKNDNESDEIAPANVAASGTLTLSGNITDGETVTIGEKTYTFQDSLTDEDGNVLIGDSASETIDNLIAAINLGEGAGTLYAESTTEHPNVVAAAGAGDTMDVTAKVAGEVGNEISTTTDAADAAFGAATLEGGKTNSGTFSIDAQTITGTVVDSNSSIKASGTLTLTGLPLDTETVVLGEKTYTFQDELTDTDGNVKIGKTVRDSLENLAMAIRLDGVAGVHYAESMTKHTLVSAVASGPDKLVVTAVSAGTSGNSIASTETLTDGEFGDTTLKGGADNIASDAAISEAHAEAAGTQVVGLLTEA